MDRRAPRLKSRKRWSNFAGKFTCRKLCTIFSSAMWRCKESFFYQSEVKIFQSPCLFATAVFFFFVLFLFLSFNLSEVVSFGTILKRTFFASVSRNKESLFVKSSYLWHFSSGFFDGFSPIVMTFIYARKSLGIKNYWNVFFLAFFSGTVT